MPLPSLQDPYVIAERILTAVVTGFGAASVTLPPVQYVAEGALPAPDGPQLTVALLRVYQGMPGQQQAAPASRGLTLLTGSFEVELLRTAVTMTSVGRQTALPTKKRLGDGGLAFGVDLLAMMNALVVARETNTIASHPSKIALSEVKTAGPEGTLAGIVATVDVLLLGN